MLLLPACNQGTKRIPANDLEQVLREMFLTDVILERSETLKILADSTLVYPPILDKYGYTTEQFMATMNYYSTRPTRFKSMLSRLRKSLDEERTLYNEQLTLKEEQRALVERFNNWLRDSVADKHDLVLKQSLKQILPYDPSREQEWSVDRDSLYKAQPLRILAVVDTTSRRDSIPLYLERPKPFKPRGMVTIKLD
ncbi:MAG TPA: DUF4296 domain-containing protein [Bacteroidales bacterium]|nr:DUF4296 domain-containing protein [Bacteroidales bacterium]HOD56948.1 DUF4296 domain-containing protein [Bacteroidales bacterium]HOZ10494.1 DUF4296 domain-containing protein [Bacteroidales bacterium]HPL84861.1 DUF4296 domain-containing protein [Bacteroidales bacterium]HPU82678.1 DUF4296 domain-containing protein [Bacteroidales bacterium]